MVDITTCDQLVKTKSGCLTLLNFKLGKVAKGVLFYCFSLQAVRLNSAVAVNILKRGDSATFSNVSALAKLVQKKPKTFSVIILVTLLKNTQPRLMHKMQGGVCVCECVY